MAQLEAVPQPEQVIRHTVEERHCAHDGQQDTGDLHPFGALGGILGRLGGLLDGAARLGGGLLAVALLLLFFILAAQFESLVQPWIILSEIVIDLFGALVVLWVFGQTLNLMSMIGLIVVCGIVINDSILKIDTINTLRREGMALKHAIMEAGRRRLKAIVMTSLTTILAVAPFLSHGDMGSDLQLPMSLTIISGMIVGTLVSVFFIPLAYYEIYRPRR